MNKAALLGLLAVPIAYLLLWPVPVDPVAWDAPQSPGLVDPFAENNLLRPARPINLDIYEGPEDIASPDDGFFYTATVSGSIVRFRANGTSPEQFADVGGRPLGIEFDADGYLLVANAYLGLQRISPKGAVELLANEYAGQKLVYVNDVAVAKDGTIYFSESSTKFGAMESGGTYEASLLDILEHGGHGRIFRLDANGGQLNVILDGLDFANGVAISDDQQYLLVAETGHYRIWRYWLEGDNAGTSEVILENLPGFPDNINNGFNGRFWIGLVAPRVEVLDKLSDHPLLRKIVQRLPAFVRPKAVPSTHVIAITGDGQLLMNLQDSAARHPSITGVFETRRALYLSTLFGDEIPRLDKRDLQQH